MSTTPKRQHPFNKSLELPKHLRPNAHQLALALTATSASQVKTQHFDLHRIAMEEVAQQILADDQNDFNFYSIQPFDKSRLKKKGGTSFTSLNFQSDAALVKSSKFFKEKKYSGLEKRLREKLRNEPGKLQLLSEM